MKIKQTRYLDGALALVGPRGLCFHRAAGLVLDLPPATLAVGTLPAATSHQQQVNPEFSSVDFIHAWVEMGNCVMAPTLIQDSKEDVVRWIFTKSDYYAANKPRNVHYLSRARLKKLSTKFGMAKHLLDFTPLKDGAKFGEIIMNELEIPFVMSKSGGILPAPRRGNE